MSTVRIDSRPTRIEVEDGTSIRVGGVTTIDTDGEVTIAQPGVDVSAEDIATAVDEYLAENPVTAGDGQTTIGAHYIVRGAVDRSTYTTSYPVAGLFVVLAGQATSAENGLYTTTTGGALDLASFVDIFTLADLGRPVFGYVVEAGTPNALFDIVSTDRYDATAVRNAVWFTVGLVGPGEIGLVASTLDPDTVADLMGTAFAPALGDFIVGEDTTLTISHNVVVFADTTEAIDVALAPHATKVRPQFLWNKGAYDVNLTQHPGDATPFAYTLGSGERIAIWPDQNAWDVWHMLPPPIEGTAGYVVAVADGDDHYELVPGIPAGDLMTLVGTIDASTNPNWPAANAGDAYRVQFPGKLGGPLGVPVEANDMAVCWVDNTAAGTNAEVGDSWSVHADPRGLGTAAFAATGDFAATSHSHAASAISSGTLDIARIPTGTSSTTVAVGNDARFAAALPGSILVQYGLDGSYTTGTAISHFSYSLPALAAGDFLEVEASIEWNNTTGSNVAFAPNLVLDSTVMTSTTTVTIATGTTRQAMVRARLYVISTSSQSCDVSYSASALGVTGLGTGVATVDVSSAGKALSLRTTTNNASAGAKVRFVTIRRSRTS